MVHEAMILEYSGAYLALLEFASWLRLSVFAVLIANFVMPFPLIDASFSLSSMISAAAAATVKLIAVMLLLSLLESSIPKMRFYRMQEYLSTAFFIAIAGLVLTVLPIA